MRYYFTVSQPLVFRKLLMLAVPPLVKGPWHRSRDTVRLPGCFTASRGQEGHAARRLPELRPLVRPSLSAVCRRRRARAAGG